MDEMTMDMDVYADEIEPGNMTTAKFKVKYLCTQAANPSSG